MEDPTPAQIGVFIGWVGLGPACFSPGLGLKMVIEVRDPNGAEVGVGSVKMKQSKLN